MLVSALPLAVLLSVDTLKTGVVLDAMSGQRTNANRELIAQGAGNLLSAFLTLLAIVLATGLVVDDGIVVTENAFRQLEVRRVDLRDRRAVLETIRDSLHLVGRPMFFSMAAILLAFTPVFALTGQEGKLFHPLAYTKTFAVLGAMIMALTLVPVLFAVAYAAGMPMRIFGVC